MCNLKLHLFQQFHRNNITFIPDPYMYNTNKDKLYMV